MFVAAYPSLRSSLLKAVSRKPTSSLLSRAMSTLPATMKVRNEMIR
jgi:hypothetical protein